MTSELDVIELEFTNDVTDPRVEVLDAGGQNHVDGEVLLDGAMVQQAVGVLESGEFTALVAATFVASSCQDQLGIDLVDREEQTLSVRAGDRA